MLLRSCAPPGTSPSPAPPGGVGLAPRPVRPPGVPSCTPTIRATASRLRPVTPMEVRLTTHSGRTLRTAAPEVRWWVVGTPPTPPGRRLPAPLHGLAPGITEKLRPFVHVTPAIRPLNALPLATQDDQSHPLRGARGVAAPRPGASASTTANPHRGCMLVGPRWARMGARPGGRSSERVSECRRRPTWWSSARA